MEAKLPLSQHRGQTILVVEDNEDLRENAALVLSLEGYDVSVAIDGQDALDMLVNGTCAPDLIVSDIAMPRLDGYAFFEAIKTIPTLRAIPFIFLTARGSRRDIRFGKELGVDDYLVKPFNSEDFLVAVKNKLRRTEEIRKQAASELDDARRAMVQLLSHELRTPLTYVTGGFSLLAEGLEQEDLPNDMQLSMGLIRSGTQRLNHLAEQLVLYAELISGHSRIHLDRLGEPLELEMIVRSTISVLERDVSPRGIHFALDINLPEAIEVWTVAEFLRTAITEVCRNAATFSHEGGEILVRMKLEGKDVIISIEDHGRGIAEADQSKIWEIMIQSERIKLEQQGAGMGLPIVKQILLMHGGDAYLESEVQKGTTVYLRLPVYHPGDRPDPSQDNQ